MFALHVSPATEINFITLDNPKKELKEGKNIRKHQQIFILSISKDKKNNKTTYFI